MNLQQCLKILELETNSSLQDAKGAYKDLVRVWHPDRFENNPRLKHKAEQKLREINLAYNYFCRHVDANQAGELASSRIASTPSSSSGSLTIQAGRSGSSRQATDAPGPAGDRKAATRHSAVPITKTSSRRSFIGRYVLLAFLVIFAATSALVVYLVYNTDEIASKTRGVASEAMDKILEHLEANQPADDKDAAVKPFIEGLDRTVKSDESQSEFEIHLVSGSIIMTVAWWEEGEMIMYRVDGGSMGIERTRVKKIVRR